MSDRPFDMPASTTKAFEPRRGAWLIQRLLDDPRPAFTNVIHPAAIVGNLAGESRLTAIQEVSPISGRGGFGWEQATGQRRLNFEGFAATRGWKVTDDLANYEFLIWELCDDPAIKGDGSENHALQRLKVTTTLEAATYTFEVLFERPSSTADVDSRVRYAQQAIDAMASPPPPPPPAPVWNPDDVAALLEFLLTAVRAQQKAGT